jgi:hypothetical protein
VSEESSVRPLFTRKEKETWLNWGFILRAPPAEINKMKEHMNKLDFKGIYVHDITSEKNLYVVEESFLEPEQIRILKEWGIKAQRP